MKIYIAGRYVRRDEFRVVAGKLRDLGHEVTSRWLQETHDVTQHTNDVMTFEQQAETAAIDLEDIDRADAMLFFAEDAYNQPPRGGRHVEFGYALRKKLIFVIGDRENIFHFLPNVFPISNIFMLGDCMLYEGKYSEYRRAEINPRLETNSAKHYDGGKPDLTLFSILPVEPLLAIADVMIFGAAKYGWNNWRGGMKWRRITGSTLRHLFSWLRGEDIDPESNLHHLAHAGCDILFTLYYIMKKVGEDDRYKTEQAEVQSSIL